MTARISKSDFQYLGQSLGILQEAAEDATEYVDGRSDKWQASEKGTAFLEWIERLELAIEALQEIDPSPVE